MQAGSMPEQKEAGGRWGMELQESIQRREGQEEELKGQRLRLTRRCSAWGYCNGCSTCNTLTHTHKQTHLKYL